ncbi:tyrosine-type recombinase/integrase [Alkalibacterium sp. s-m-22]|uniref:Tyrosine-type recombinase/integrase n=1 Tax=Alkalibacterium iburiense TaxID=290589 RepID=A0ABP3HP74_9LACT
MSKSFYFLLEEFLCYYLPHQRGYSPNTIRSYYTTLCSIIYWMENNQNIPKELIEITDFTKSRVNKWLMSIEQSGSSISTRNQRLAGLRSFLSFVVEEEIIYQNVLLELNSIHVKKAPRPITDFLTLEEVKGVLSIIPIDNSMSFKHYVILCTLYDSGTRVNELCNIKIEDIVFDKHCSIKICGKRNKTRIIYLSPIVAKQIKKYINQFGITEGYLFRNRYETKISDSGIDYIIKKYSQMANKSFPNLQNKKISAHTFRRSKATHMLLNGVNLSIIQRFLGHESIQTTEVYLEVGSQAMIEAVERNNKLILANTDFKDDSMLNKDTLEQIRLKLFR